MGSSSPKVRAALMALDAAEAAQLLQAGSDLTVDVDGETVTLGNEEVLVQTESRGGMAVASDKGVTVAVDTKLTPALLQEGYARDLVRAINNMRKEAGLDISDRIELAYEADGDVSAAFVNFADYIKQETLALTLENHIMKDPTYQSNLEVGGEETVARSAQGLGYCQKLALLANCFISGKIKNMKSRRFVGQFVLVFIFLILVTAVSQAQTDPTRQPDDDLLIIKTPPKAMIDGIFSPTPNTNTVDNMTSPMWLSAAEEPADSCSEAPALIVIPSNPADGGVANVSSATEAADDPVLSCMWGNPTRPQGYRTVWYKLFAPVNGRVTIDTFNSTYDTVLGVYRGTCVVEDPDNPPPPLEPLSCNDDHNGFSSQVSFSISQGETYFIEVADRDPGTPQPPVMQLSALLEPVESKWSQTVTSPATPAISRHAVVAQGEYVYIIGGQTGESGLPQISNKLLRFNTNTLAIDDDQDGMAVLPLAGFSNTTAALVNNQIYVPAGYNGNNSSYYGTHWDI